MAFSAAGSPAKNGRIHLDSHHLLPACWAAPLLLPRLGFPPKLHDRALFRSSAQPLLLPFREPRHEARSSQTRAARHFASALRSLGSGRGGIRVGKGERGSDRRSHAARRCSCAPRVRVAPGCGQILKFIQGRRRPMGSGGLLKSKKERQEGGLTG